MARLAQTSIRFRRYEIGPEGFERLSVEIDAVGASRGPDHRITQFGFSEMP